MDKKKAHLRLYIDGKLVHSGDPAKLPEEVIAGQKHCLQWEYSE